MHIKHFRPGALALALATALAIVPLPALAQVDPSTTDAPILSREAPRGTGTTEPSGHAAPVGKVVDGNISDWISRSSLFGGTVVYSGGELVYQDHLFDAYGPDDGRDADRLAKTDGVEEVLPEAYRIDALAQANAPDQVGAPVPPGTEQFMYDETYGDSTSDQDHADLTQLRLAREGDSLALLARTTTMRADSKTALLVLLDSVEGGLGDVGFGSGVTSAEADAAVFLTRDSGAVSVGGGPPVALPAGSVASDPSGYTNSIEARIPLSAFGGPNALRVAAATGTANAAGDGFAPLEIEQNNDVEHANLANVAFRLDEPVRIWFEKEQALSLHSGSIDRFFHEVDEQKLGSGVVERYVPGTGYHDRIFISSEQVASEQGENGIFQHYGVFLPTAYDGATPLPLQWWLHWRGGSAHSGGAIVPRVFKHFGEDVNSIVVAPSGRGSSYWYVGKGHVDFREVWADVFDTFAVDRNRVYSSGHSMGGFGTYLLTLLYPDRFAAGAPVAGPVTQGAWTGLDFPGCDQFDADGNTPCFIEANGSEPRAQHTRKLLGNARHVPYAILHGTDDELVFYSGVARQAEQLTLLNYRHRFYTYPGYEHFTHPVMDQWAEASRYMHTFATPEHPRQVTYTRDMGFERATERVQAANLGLDFSFDSAYWMSGLAPAGEPAAANETETRAAVFDGVSLAVSEPPHLVLPDAGGPASPGTTGPYFYEGLQWLADPSATAPEAINAFDITLTGAKAVSLDLAGMQIDPTRVISGAVTTDPGLDLSLKGDWTRAPDVTIDGQPVSAALNGDMLLVNVPAGDHVLEITPGTQSPNEPVIAFTSRSATSGQYSDEATLEARLVDASGAALSERTVEFVLTGPAGSQAFNALTNADGIATLSLSLNDVPGDYWVTARHALSEGSIEANSPFTIEREDTALSLSTQGNGAKKTLRGVLVDPDAGGIAGRAITFTSNGETLGTAITDENGVATLAVPAGARGGNRSYSASFDGDEFYKPSSG